MMSSHSRILANLSSKENMSPRRKRSSEEAFSSSPPGKVIKRRTVDAFLLPKKSKPLFSSKSSNKLNVKKQASIKSYYREGLKQTSSKVKVFDENKANTKQKPKQDDAFSMMCAEEAPEKYWELLAEERRKGLEIALKENKELAEEIQAKDETIKNLRTEVSELQETAKHAEYLATVLEELGKDCGVAPEEGEESDSDSEVFDEKDISISYDEDNTKPSTSTSNIHPSSEESPVSWEKKEECLHPKVEVEVVQPNVEKTEVGDKAHLRENEETVQPSSGEKEECPLLDDAIKE